MPPEKAWWHGMWHKSLKGNIAWHATVHRGIMLCRQAVFKTGGMAWHGMASEQTKSELRNK